MEVALAEDGHPADEGIYDTHVMAWVNGRRSQHDHLEHEAFYSYEDEFGFRAGSYSGNNEWRDALARLAGYKEWVSTSQHIPNSPRLNSHWMKTASLCSMFRGSQIFPWKENRGKFKILSFDRKMKEVDILKPGNMDVEQLRASIEADILFGSGVAAFLAGLFGVIGCVLFRNDYRSVPRI